MDLAAQLRQAVLARDPAQVRALLEQGADPRAGIYPIEEATNACALASLRGDSEILAVLQEFDSLRAGPEDIPRAFLLAARQGRDADAIALLAAHPELRQLCHPSNGYTPLHVACGTLRHAIVEWLIENGADLHARGHNGDLPAHVLGLIRWDSGDARHLAQSLRRRGSPRTPRIAVLLEDLDNLTEFRYALEAAVRLDRPDLLTKLLEMGADPDDRRPIEGDDATPYTWGDPLYICARTGRHQMARILLEHGADPNAQVYASGTPLSEAFGQADDAMVDLLIAFGGKPNPSMAGLYRRLDLAVELLAQHGDTPLPDDGFGSGPVASQLLAAAARGGDPHIIRLALQHLDWPRGDERWYTALGNCLSLWNHFPGPWARPDWDRKLYLECFQILLEQTGPPVKAPRHGVTVLHRIAAESEHVREDERAAFAAAALDAGARLDARDELLESTPLAWAVRWGRTQLVELYLQRGADPAEPAPPPWARPLAWAVRRQHRENAQLLESAINDKQKES
jgi:ankyrin repeat protein